MAELDKVLKAATDYKASDLHLAPGEPFILRQFGRLIKIQSLSLTREKCERLIYELLENEQQETLNKRLQLDFAYEIPEVARFRGSAMRHHAGLSASFRIIPFEIPTFEKLGLPDTMKKIMDNHQGLVLVTGATGQGKSSTLAAMVDYINKNRTHHIITVEDPVEFIHPLKGCAVNQRQLGRDTLTYANALRAALREDPDVIVVGELRDLETISLVITAAETGHLVIGTLATSNAPKTVDRIIDSFPAAEQGQIRAMLGESLKAVITQRLIPRADLTSMALAVEILIGTLSIANLIRDGKVFQIPSMMQMGKVAGMQIMDESIMSLLQAGTISAKEAYENANNKALFKSLADKEIQTQKPLDQRMQGAEFKLYMTLSESGDAAVQNRLGLMYQNGEGVTRDDAEAVRWYLKSAEQGYAAAQNNLGLMYQNGKGVKQDNAEAIKWFRKAAEQGDTDAQDNIVRYQKGEEVDQGKTETVKWYLEAAEQGDAEAQYNLGLMYQNGKGVPQDYAKTIKWYRKAAEQGNAAAQNNLGWMYQNGLGVPPDYSEAVKWYRKAAEQGNAAAQNNLGWIYQSGKGVSQDYAEAIRWYLKAAEQGHVAAQYNLGLIYQNGEGVPLDYAKAIKWFREAAKQNDADAKNNLGLIYSTGLQDYTEAAKWFLKAAEQGIANAQFNYGLILDEGRGVQKDSDSAMVWYSEAAKQGHAEAQLKLDEMKNK